MTDVEWTFGTFLWSTLVFFFWFAVIWMFISIFADILRRDMSGWAKAGWIVLIIALPLIGMLIYVITRPRAEERDLLGDVVDDQQPYQAADEIAKAALLQSEGKITAGEYEQLKRQALGYR